MCMHIKIYKYLHIKFKSHHTFWDSNGIRYIQYLFVTIQECNSYLLDGDIDKQMTSVHKVSNN